MTVAANAAATVTNTATVAGGGDTSAGNNIAMDLTHITAVAPDLTITKTHTDPFAQGGTNDPYTITVTNIGNGASSGAVTVTDTAARQVSPPPDSPAPAGPAARPRRWSVRAH